MTEVVEMITLAEICAEIDMKPQAARIKLRRKMKEAKGENFRWAFPVEQKDEIIELLTTRGGSPAGDDGEE